ncbi:MAG: hypothetical protein JNK15_10240 [Planctomycetes bacterium]|nr:hypothetical protein [Planctomycetota bacterium]
MSARNESLGVECKDGGKVHVAGEHVGNILVDGKPTTVFDDDHTPRNDIEALARALVAKFGIAKARSIAFLAREARVKGESLQQLVEHCRAAGIEIDDDFTPPAAKQQTFGFDTTHQFLGEEYLLHLWWKIETEGGEFTLPGGRVVGVAIDDVLQFAPHDGDDTVHSLRRGMPTRSPEARTALRQGHRVSHARLLIAEGSRQWSVTMHGAVMKFGGVKLPEDAEECESAIDRTTDRAANWLALHEIVEALFGRFLRVRIGETWKQEAAAMAAWMQS